MPLAIMKVENDRIAKFAGFKTTQDAEAHVARFADDFPNAFVVPTPQKNILDYRVENNTLVLDPIQQPLRPLKKITIIRRLHTAGLLPKYKAAFDSPTNIFFREAWYAAGPIKPDDTDVLAFFTAIAEDPAVVATLLAPE